MSADATGWVYRHSPTKGATFLVHMAAGDSANDQHGYELFMRQSWLAAKARVSRKAAGEALAWLTDNGFLVLLEEGKARGAPNRYRFLFPDVPVVWDPRGATHGGTLVGGLVAQGVTPGGRGVSPVVAHNPRGNSSNPNARAAARVPVSDERFAKWWPAYPDRDGKRLGKAKALGYWSKLTIEEQRAAYRGAVNLGRAVAGGGRFGIPDPWRFLRDRTWEDWQEPAVVANGKITPGDPIVAASWDRARREDAQRCPIHGSIPPEESVPDCDGCRRVAAHVEPPANGWAHLDNGLLT